MTPWADQIAVVTGASRGVGKAIALALAARGATLCIVGRHHDTLREVAESAGATAPRVQCYQADLSVGEHIKELAERLRYDFGRIDMLVHSAGVIALGSLECASVEDFDWHYRTNVRAPYLLTQGLLPMIKLQKGQIVFINSTVGLRATAKAGQYAATKHALRAIADSLREEVNADGVRVLSVFLGRTASPLQAAVHETEGRAYRPELLMQPEDVAAVVINTLSLPRSAEVTDISMRPLVKSY